MVNLGGTAIGTGLAAPTAYIFQVVEELREITGLGLARAENLVEATQNLDTLVEVSGLLKALATTLIKICSDLRLLSSGPEAGLGELRLPPRQAGSSIMPGKVNPVIPEAVTQAAVMAIGPRPGPRHRRRHGLPGAERLHAPGGPLPAGEPGPAGARLRPAAPPLRDRPRGRLEARCRAQVENGTAAATALLPLIGYERAAELAARARGTGRGLKEVALASGLVTAEQFDQLTSPEAVGRLGWRIPAR